jgi:hypothetical protein
MTYKIQLETSKLAPEDLHDLTREFSQELLAEVGLSNKLEYGESRSGQKGDPVTIGVILIALIKSGAVLGLVKLISSYISRVPSIEVGIVRTDGTTLTIRTRDIQKGDLNGTERLVRDFLDLPGHLGSADRA